MFTFNLYSTLKDMFHFISSFQICIKSNFIRHYFDIEISIFRYDFLFFFMKNIYYLQNYQEFYFPKNFALKKSIQMMLEHCWRFGAPSMILFLYLSPNPSKSQTIKTSSPATDHLCFIFCGQKAPNLLIPSLSYFSVRTLMIPFPLDLRNATARVT